MIYQINKVWAKGKITIPLKVYQARIYNGDTSRVHLHGDDLAFQTKSKKEAQKLIRLTNDICGKLRHYVGAKLVIKK